jgi:hypothetical protein
VCGTFAGMLLLAILLGTCIEALFSLTAQHHTAYETQGLVRSRRRWASRLVPARPS